MEIRVDATVPNKSYLQWLGDVYVKYSIFVITFGHGGQIRFQKPATANSQTLWRILLGTETNKHYERDYN
jgi:hypothetical protein